MRFVLRQGEGFSKRVIKVIRWEKCHGSPGFTGGQISHGKVI
jgi:hypothetical protein